MRDRERKAYRNCRIDRITAIHKHLAAGIGSERLLRNHHGMLGANRIFSARPRRESSSASRHTANGRLCRRCILKPVYQSKCCGTITRL